MLVEITQRTHRGRYLLRPGRDTRAVFLGAVGYARSRVPGVLLLDYHCLSNHFGLLLAVKDLSSLAAFEQAMNGRLSKELKWLRRYDDFVFPRAYRMVQVADEAALRERFIYARGNAVKEGLVRHPSQWTGPHAARQWHHGEVARGYYHDFTAYDRARRRKDGARVKRSDFRRYVTIELDKAPCSRRRRDQTRQTRGASSRQGGRLGAGQAHEQSGQAPPDHGPPMRCSSPRKKAPITFRTPTMPAARLA